MFLSPLSTLLFTPLKCNLNVNPTDFSESKVLEFELLLNRVTIGRGFTDKSKGQVLPFRSISTKWVGRTSLSRQGKERAKQIRTKRGFCTMLISFKLIVNSNFTISSMIFLCQAALGQGDSFWKRKNEKVSGKIMYLQIRPFSLINLCKYTDSSQL